MVAEGIMVQHEGLWAAVDVRLGAGHRQIQFQFVTWIRSVAPRLVVVVGVGGVVCGCLMIVCWIGVLPVFWGGMCLVWVGVSC